MMPIDYESKIPHDVQDVIQNALAKQTDLEEKEQAKDKAANAYRLSQEARRVANQRLLDALNKHKIKRQVVRLAGSYYLVDSQAAFEGAMVQPIEVVE